MDRAGPIASRRGPQRVQERPLWSMPKPLVALWAVVTCGYLSWVGARVADFHFRLTDIGLFCALLACGAFSVEMARRASEPAAPVKDVYAVWELPMVFLLPGIYVLIVGAIRLSLTQLLVRKEPLHRRVYTAAAIGISYGCASVVYTSVIPVGSHQRASLWSHPTMWLAAAGAGALTQWAVNQVLVLAACKLDSPSARLRAELPGRESLHNDATELCAALLVAVGMTVSSLTLIFALPLATLLQRSFRHAYLLNEARADSKTGLLNAATWEREATAEVARAVRTSSPLAVALLDLDRFKRINDTHGHLIGDEVLREIAQLMSGMLREYDLAGRFGGEEFVMLLPQTRATDAFKIADRVRARIAELPIRASNGERVLVTVSIGVAALDAGSNRELTELLAAADAALYRAKASGRDQVQMISTSRGLSAVSPIGGDDFAAAAYQMWHPGLHSPGDLPADPAAAARRGRREAGRGAATGAGRGAASGAGALDHDGKFQVPAEGAASTAITSALAV